MAIKTSWLANWPARPRQLHSRYQKGILHRDVRKITSKWSVQTGVHNVWRDLPRKRWPHEDLLEQLPWHGWVNAVLTSSNMRRKVENASQLCQTPVNVVLCVWPYQLCPVFACLLVAYALKRRHPPMKESERRIHKEGSKFHTQKDEEFWVAPWNWIRNP